MDFPLSLFVECLLCPCLSYLQLKGKLLSQVASEAEALGSEWGAGGIQTQGLF